MGYLPPEHPFHHVGTEVHYRGDSSQGYRICNGSGEDPTCADQNSQANVAALLMQCLVPSDCGHLTYLEPAKLGLMSAPACRVRRLSGLFLAWGVGVLCRLETSVSQRFGCRDFF